jgi:hypothetical protein
MREPRARQVQVRGVLVVDGRHEAALDEEGRKVHGLAAAPRHDHVAQAAAAVRGLQGQRAHGRGARHHPGVVALARDDRHATRRPNLAQMHHLLLL